MRRVLLISGVLFALAVVGIVVALLLFDPNSLREPLVTRISDQLERPVELGELDLAFFPTPALRAHALRVGGSSPQAPPLLEVEELRLRVALLPLLAGRAVLRALEIDAPRIHLELDAEGRPILPAVDPSAESKAKPADDMQETPADGPTLAVQRIRITDASLQAGAWQVEKLQLSGRLHLDRSAEFSFEADLPGLFKLRNGNAELEGLGTDALVATVRGEIQGGNLATLRKRLELEPELAGGLEGDFELGLRDGELRDAQLTLHGRELRVKSGDVALEGEADVDAKLGERWQVDLTRSRVDVGEALRKPAGLKATISGELGSQPSLAALRNALVTLGTNQIPLEFDLDKQPLVVRIEPTTLELTPLAELMRSDELPQVGGQVVLEPWRVQLEPLAFSGMAQLQDVTLSLEHGTVSVSGSLRGEKTRLHGTGIRVVAGGQQANLSGSYDIASGVAALDGSVSQADAQALAQALLGKSELSGTLNTNLRLRGQPAPTLMTGSGKLEITDGRIKGFSMLEQVLGGLAKLPVLMASAKGKDLSRYEEEEFKRLAADFQLSKGLLHMEQIILEYRHATAYLHGTVGVVDGALALAGRVVLDREVGEELGDKRSGREKVIPIAGIGGTVSRPRVKLDASALAALAEAYTGQGEVREKLEEKLGKEGADALEDILQGILGGRKKSR